MTSTNDILVADIGPRPTDFVGWGPLCFALFVICAPITLTVAMTGGPVPLVVIGSAVCLAAVARALFDIPAYLRYEDSVQEWKGKRKKESKRVRHARLDFLSERGVEVPSAEVNGLFPDTLRVKDGLVAMSQGVVDGKATMLALHQRDGELVLTGTDGQELRPLVAA